MIKRNIRKLKKDLKKVLKGKIEIEEKRTSFKVKVTDGKIKSEFSLNKF